LTQLGQLTVLHSFGSTVLLNGLIQGADGNFYGTTQNGGSAGDGAVFEMTPQGTVTILHSFGDKSVANDGTLPNGIIQGSDTNFYGTTQNGGSTGDGVVFEMTPQGTVTILHNFGDKSVTHDGAQPNGLIQGSDSNFYGTTQNGGSAGDGTVFQITPQGTVTIFHNFGDQSVTNDGLNPKTALLQGYDGNFYGTTTGGGSFNEGTIFQITPGQVVTIAHSFGDPQISAYGSGISDGTIPLV